MNESAHLATAQDDWNHALWLSGLCALINENRAKLQFCQSRIPCTHTCTANHISRLKEEGRGNVRIGRSKEHEKKKFQDNIVTEFFINLGAQLYIVHHICIYIKISPSPSFSISTAVNNLSVSFSKH